MLCWWVCLCSFRDFWSSSDTDIEAMDIEGLSSFTWKYRIVEIGGHLSKVICTQHVWPSQPHIWKPVQDFSAFQVFVFICMSEEVLYPGRDTLSLSTLHILATSVNKLSHSKRNTRARPVHINQHNPNNICSTPKISGRKENWRSDL